MVCRVFHKSAGGKKMPLAEIKQSNALTGDDSTQDDNADVLKLGSTLPGLMELPLAGSYKDSSWQLPDKPPHSWTPPAYLMTGGAGAAAPNTMSHLTNLLNSLPHPTPTEDGKFSLFSSNAQPELHDNMNFGMRTSDKYSFSMENANMGAVGGDIVGLNAIVNVGGAGNRHANILEAFAENVRVGSGTHSINAVLQRPTAADTSACAFDESRFALSVTATGSERRGGAVGNTDVMKAVFETYVQRSSAGSGRLSEAVSYEGGRKAEGSVDEYECSRSKGSVEACASSSGGACMGLMQEGCNVAQMQAPAMASFEKYSSRGFKSPSLSPQAALSSDYSSSNQLYAAPVFHFPSDLESLYWVSS